jgi:hypothetical protein
MAINSALPAIPAIDDPILRDAVSALCHAAVVFQRCFAAVCEGGSPEELLDEHGDLLRDAERVLGAWRDHLGHTVEELLDDV